MSTNGTSTSPDICSDLLEAHPSGNLFVSFESLYFRSQRHLLPPDQRERIIETKDFRSGERNFFELPDAGACSRASVAHADRIYASTP